MRWVRRLARLLVLAVYAWAGLALMPGQDLLTNPIFGFVYVWMWVGLVPISLLLGQFWRATNPLRTLHRGLCALARIDPRAGPAAAAPPDRRLARRRGTVRLQLARAGPAGSHHAGRAAGLGAGLAGDLGHRRDRLRFALDRRGRPVRGVREHGRPALPVAPGQRSAPAGQSAGRPERLAAAAGIGGGGRGAARQHRVRQLRQHQLVDPDRAELRRDHHRLGHRRAARHDHHRAGQLQPGRRLDGPLRRSAGPGVPAVDGRLRSCRS